MRALVDTNVFVYLYDAGSPAKQRAAARLVQALAARGDTAVAAQSLAEFSVVALRKLEPPMPVDDVAEAVRRISAAFTVLPLSPSLVAEALRGVRDHQLSYFDAQIWAAARLAQIGTVISEDFASGATVDGVTFRNPFAAGAEEAVLGT